MRQILFTIFVLVATIASAADITFELSKPGNVSAAIYDSQGHLLRTLLYGKALPGGKHSLQWDGLDRYGNAMPPGEYEWRILRNEGLQAEYLLSFGSNPNSAPFHLWVGNHAGPRSAHVDVDGSMYVAAMTAENAPVLIKQSLDGTRRFWENYSPRICEGPWDGGVALATDGRRALYMLQNNGLVQVIDAGTGDLLVERTGSQAWAGGIRDRAKRKWDPLPDGVGGGADIAARNETFVICSRDCGDVRWLKIDDGRVVNTVKVSAPSSLDLAPDGTVYVVSEDKILAVWRDGAPRTIVEGLLNPGRLAYDEANNQLLVAHGQLRPNQVSRYDLGGKLVKTYGKPGGRGFGPYEPRDFFNIVDLTADRQGGFVVVESGRETFRRTARFDAGGKLLAEWHGGQKWGSFVAFDPADPTHVMFSGGDEVKALAVADYQTRTYRVTHLLRAPDTGGLMPSLTAHTAMWQLRHFGGNLYLVNVGGDRASSAPAVYRADLIAGLAVPVARTGNVNASQIWDFKKNVVLETAPPFWLEAVRRRGVEIDKNLVLSGELSGYSWSDDNGNGKADPEELVLGPSFGYSSLFIDADWNLLLAGSPAKPQEPFVHAVPNHNLGGVPPRWVWSDAKPLPNRAPDEWAKLGRAESSAVCRGADCSLYVFAKGHAHPGDDRQAENWPANTSGAVRLMKWNPAGQLEWSVGRHANVNDSPPGQFHDPMRILGEVRGNVVVQDRVIRVAQVFTADGLYAGDFLDRHVADGLPEDIYRTAGSAHQPGLFLHDHIGGVMQVAPDGEVLWNPSGRTGAPVFRIHGWDGWERQSGRIRLDKPASAARAEGTGLCGSYFKNTKWEGAPVLTRTDAQLWFGNRALAFTQDLSGRPWIGKKDKGPFDLKNFSARWEGKLEAPLSEAYQFVLEYDEGSTVRLWIDGELIAESRAEIAKSGRALPRAKQAKSTPVPAGTPEVEDASKTKRGKAVEGPPAKTRRVISKPIPMTAGSQHEIKIEYASSGDGRPQMHLEWESFTQERQHVPTTLMYPCMDQTDHRIQ